LHGFAGKYRRRSQRCEDLIAAIGLNTNCESQSLYKESYSKSQIVKMLNTTYKRIRKYLNGNPDVLCKSDGRNTCTRVSLLDPYKTKIEQLLFEGNNYTGLMQLM